MILLVESLPDLPGQLALVAEEVPATTSIPFPVVGQNDDDVSVKCHCTWWYSCSVCGLALPTGSCFWDGASCQCKSSDSACAGYSGTPFKIPPTRSGTKFGSFTNPAIPSYWKHALISKKICRAKGQVSHDTLGRESTRPAWPVGSCGWGGSCKAGNLRMILLDHVINADGNK